VKPGIVILAELESPLREEILAIQERFDPKLAKLLPPHVTITGSSGMGPIPARTPLQTLRGALQVVAATTPPMTLALKRPMQFMQSQVVVLPLDPHGPIRELHDRLLTSGLPYEQPRFTFTPHVTLNLFRELSKDELRALLQVRITTPVRVASIAAYRSTSPASVQRVLELPLTGA
jgi:2'-5' RNA ligase